MEQSTQPGAGFNPRLESLRGLAALGVVFTHCFGTFTVGGLKAYWSVPFSGQPPSAQFLTVIGSLLNPGGAIVVFFILSGYVLTLSFLRSKESLARQLGPYLFRRVFRLLPAMWVSILVIVTMRHLLSETVPISLQSDFYPVFLGPISVGAIARNFVLNKFQVNPVTWTMYIEVVCSFFIPLMVAITRRGRAMGFGLLLILIVVAWLTHSDSGSDARHYLFCFQIGVFLACFPDLTRKIQWPRALFVGGCVVIFIQRVAMINNLRGTLLLAVGATLLLAAVLGAQSVSTFRWLDRAPVRFLGRVSYSFYLLHLAVIYALAQAFVSLGILKFSGILPEILLTAGTVVFTAPLAWASYTAIELPSIRYGKTAFNSLRALAAMS